MVHPMSFLKCAAITCRKKRTGSKARTRLSISRDCHTVDILLLALSGPSAISILSAPH